MDLEIEKVQRMYFNGGKQKIESPCSFDCLGFLKKDY
jgi:hypothetical protein